MTEAEFLAKYGELCNESGLELAMEPVFKKTEEGEFHLTYHYIIQKIILDNEK